jgi:hypothetical protein
MIEFLMITLVGYGVILDVVIPVVDAGMTFVQGLLPVQDAL